MQATEGWWVTTTAETSPKYTELLEAFDAARISCKNECLPWIETITWFEVLRTMSRTAQPLEQGCITFSLLPAASRVLLWTTAASEFEIFYILHCFCSAFTYWACPAPHVCLVFLLLSSLYPYSRQRVFNNAPHHNFHILNYIIMCTAASIFIEGHLRPLRLCTTGVEMRAWNTVTMVACLRHVKILLYFKKCL